MVDYAAVLVLQMYVSENRKEHEGAIDWKVAIVSVTELPLTLATLASHAVDVGLQTD